ncbi:MAG: VanZ family protein [Lachnospiraceae bacterium]|jgi:VanZ family protein|nr:VanZ family protein [Lachnospiraceae bacterium]
MDFYRKQRANRARRRMLLMWLPAIGMAALIFGFSAQPAAASTKTSDSVTRLLLRIADATRLFDTGQDSVQAWCERLSLPVRKTAHMAEYVIFYGTILLGLYGSGLRGKKWPLRAFSLTLFYACTDEIHQIFVPGRAGRVSDVLIDGIGAGALTMLLYHWQQRRERAEAGAQIKNIQK